MSISVIDVADLSSHIPAACDAELAEAASSVGFLLLTHLPGWRPAPLAHALTAVFDAGDHLRAGLLKNNDNPANANRYRGMYNARPGAGSNDRPQGYDLGPDLLYPVVHEFADDLLYEPTPLPPADILPDWKLAATAWYRAMERLGVSLLSALARQFGFPDGCFSIDRARSVSTLRLLHYPAFDLAPRVVASPGKTVRHRGEDWLMTIGEHVDSGLVTLLNQCDQPGLQARLKDGVWVDVPVIPDTVVVNFGGLLERWTGGRIKATRHRVLSRGARRCSIPFFFEPEAHRVVEPLPGVRAFAPFQYGDYLWTKAVGFPPNLGLGPLRPNWARFIDPLTD